MRIHFAAIAALAIAAPALADTNSGIVAHGMIVSIAGNDIDLSFTPDGKFSGLEGQLTGTWKIDGEKLCTTSNLAPEENCSVFPADKKSGDSFDITNEQGTATVKIK